ncbi:Sec63 Brl domain-containing protein [Aspergillus cavernicola]|uniref:DNA 3'-5' helicase n=1 Tax=Aspergillus cavernicola TaxID=176166 RepID=A0ABR4HC54_9EURO
MKRAVNRPFSVPRQATGPSWKRKVDDRHFPASSKSHSNNLIDERLVEGAQSAPFYNKSFGQASQSYHLSSTQLPPSRGEEYEDDIQLDAFDLELLAHSDGNAKSLQSSSNKYFSTYQPRRVEPSTQASRFFNDSQVTPHRSLGSSSSDVDGRDASSPLARIKTGRTAGLFRDQGMETQRITHSFHPHPVPAACPDPITPFQNIPVSIRGIVLLSVRELPDNYRSIFHFPVFNAVQSKCFETIYKTDENVVLAAPTGSGKTVVMELAICRLLHTLKDEQFKVVYQAPTKSLCSERFRDWNRKFQSLGLQCAELTGDTDHTKLRNVQNSQIIITTPEKWDSMTRKWKDHARLMQLVKLFLIDEVHTLKESRGATLEAVVSRMKSIGSNVRFVALSATIPNSEDIATWLGRNSTSQHVPAHREHFGEEFRPVILQKFVYGYQSHGNDFAFDKLCNSKLSDVISTHSARKPIMIFCCTRNSSVATAKELARLWSMSNPPARLWKGLNKPMAVNNADLKNTSTAGVAFHHAGLDPSDRHQVENGFLEGKISIICCTSTLAVGVNLPCHLVIIKNTVGWQDGCCQEYSDLEVMQMLGRAGRPQFDDSATAVILTRKERVSHYEKLVSGSESLESCLHLNLIDHLNAEIGLGNVTSIESATSWLAGTFLFVRLRRNPTHYKLKEGANRDDEDDMLRQICEKDITLLQECELVTSASLKATPFGDAMARYYIRFETMKTFHTLKLHSDVAQILSVISKAEEFHDVRLKAGEKSLYKEINRASGINFPINVDIALPAHKISLLIQSELGVVEFPSSEQFQKHKFAFQQDKNFVFSHVNRLIRCIIDCQVHLQDSITVQNALELARSLAAKVWDNSPFQMKQIEQIGVVAVRKLAAAGIDSLEALEDTEPHRIDMTLSKNPPFGMKLRSRLSDFPKLRVSVKMAGKDTKPGQSVRVRFKAEIAFMNEKCPAFFQRRPVFVCFLAERSDGCLIDFRRISASKLQRNHEITLSAEVKHQDHCITCHVMCDEIAGTSRYATLKPDLLLSLFLRQSDRQIGRGTQADQSVIVEEASKVTSSSKTKLDRFDSDEFLFGEFLESGIVDNWNDNSVISNFEESSTRTTARTNWPKDEGIKPNEKAKSNGSLDREPGKPENGRWACGHKCKDKTTCKHLCCREGLAHPPKVTRKKSDGDNQERTGSNQLTLPASLSKRDSRPRIVTVASKQYEDRQSLSDLTHRLLTGLKEPSNDNSVPLPADSSSDYGDESFDDLPSPSALLFGNTKSSMTSNSQKLFDNTQPDQRVTEFADDWIDGDDVLFPVQSPLIRPCVKENTFTESCLVDLVSPEPQGIFSVPSQSAGSGEYKRKLSIDESGIGNNDVKRVKRFKSGGRFRDSLQEKEVSNLTVQAKKDDEIEALQTPNLSIPADWGDIDPALLDEFKDIVDFF